MSSARALPADSLLRRYAERADGGYADCFAVEVPQPVPLAQFVEAFYSSPAFWAERFMVGLLFGRRATDQDARRLARGEAEVFSAWRTEARSPGKLLMCEAISGRTRLWLAATPPDRALVGA